MSEDEELKDNPMECMRCDTCEACYVCQVGDVPEVRKYQSTTVEYLDLKKPYEAMDIEEYIKRREKDTRDALKFGKTLDRIERKKQRDPLIEFLKYIFFFKWLKVTWK